MYEGDEILGRTPPADEVELLRDWEAKRAPSEPGAPTGERG